ncbi:MAG: hypothetical protein Q9170_005596 [Blastenia crenularia]
MFINVIFGQRYHNLACYLPIVFLLILLLSFGLDSNRLVFLRSYQPKFNSQHSLRRREKESASLSSTVSYVPTSTGSYHEPPLERREDIDLHYYACKGDRALNMLTHDPPSIRAFKRQDLDTAWIVSRSNGKVNTQFLPLFEQLGIPHGPRDVQSVSALQYKDFPATDRRGTVPYTGGYYVNQFIPCGSAHGTIVAELNYSPKGVTSPGRAIPELNRWSDVVWLLWSDIAQNNTRNLQYILRDNVRTDTTIRIMEQIEKTGGQPLNLPWPGHGYDMRSDAGKALLASPHGIGIAYLLRDHRDVLGRRTPYVRVFTLKYQALGSGKIKRRSDDGSTPIY